MGFSAFVCTPDYYHSGSLPTFQRFQSMPLHSQANKRLNPDLPVGHCRGVCAALGRETSACSGCSHLLLLSFQYRHSSGLVGGAPWSFTPHLKDKHCGACVVCFMSRLCVFLQEVSNSSTLFKLGCLTSY